MFRQAQHNVLLVNTDLITEHPMMPDTSAVLLRIQALTEQLHHLNYEYYQRDTSKVPDQEVAAITAPKQELSFMADGVLIVN